MGKRILFTLLFTSSICGNLNSATGHHQIRDLEYPPKSGMYWGINAGSYISISLENIGETLTTSELSILYGQEWQVIQYTLDPGAQTEYEVFEVPTDNENFKWHLGVTTSTYNSKVRIHAAWVSNEINE